MEIYIQSVLELRKKVASSKALYVSHIEAMQNVVRLHNAGNKAKLEELSSLASSTSGTLEQVSIYGCDQIKVFPFWLSSSNPDITFNLCMH